MKILHWILITFFLTAITIGSDGTELQSLSVGKTLIGKNVLQAATITDSILIEQRAWFDFSKVGQKDEFYICIRGKSIAEGNVIFTITSHDKTTILREEFPSNLLIGYGLDGDQNSVKDREDYIKNRIKDFFGEKNLSYPAIKQDEVFDEDYSDKEIWNDIKSDQTAVGFFYLIGEEDGRNIAYSKKTKKVVMYFNCC
ncbi:MAG: hypothetical protein WC699_11270 [Bacteroidales bacterium]|jgi:hypothetical protein